MSLRKLAEPVAILAAVVLVVVLSAVVRPDTGAKPVLGPEQLRRLYEPFDWGQRGVPLEAGSPASAVAGFLACLRDGRWKEASSLVVPQLRGTRDELYFQSRFGPIIEHLDSWLIVKQKLVGSYGRVEVATSSDRQAAILWVTYTAKKGDRWFVTGTMKPVNEIRLVEDWSTVREDHFRVHYAGEEVTVLRVLDGLVQQYTRLSQIFGVDIEVVDVYLVQEGAKWPFVLGEGARPESAGFVDRNIVLLATPSTEPNRLNQTAAHELVHMFVARRAGGHSVPLWFNEGLAVYLANEPPRNMDQACRVARTNAASVKRLFSSGPLQPWGYDYTLSWAAVQFIEVTFGPGTSVELLRQVGNGSSWEEAVRRVTGHDKQSFYRLIDSHLQHLCAEFQM